MVGRGALASGKGLAAIIGGACARRGDKRGKSPSLRKGGGLSPGEALAAIFAAHTWALTAPEGSRVMATSRSISARPDLRPPVVRSSMIPRPSIRGTCMSAIST